MINFEKYDSEMLVARGKYSTVRKEHEQAKKELSQLVGKLTSFASQILRKMQPDFDDEVADINDLLELAKWTIAEVEKTSSRISSLAQQKESLRSTAWPTKDDPF